MIAPWQRVTCDVLTTMAPDRAERVLAERGGVLLCYDGSSPNNTSIVKFSQCVTNCPIEHTVVVSGFAVIVTIL